LILRHENPIAVEIAWFCFVLVEVFASFKRGHMDTSAVCEVCGNYPAARIKLRRGVGLVLARRIYTADAVLCDVCAAAATSEYQSKTAIQGWTSPHSALMNPFYLASNAINRAKHKKRLRDS